MAPPPPPPPPAAGLKALNPKQYILAALTATLATAVIVTVIFIVLSPARIHFSVTEAGYHKSGDHSVLLTLTITSNNTSRRAGVKYQSMFVEVKNNTGPEFNYALRANVTTDLPLSQRSASVANVTATVFLVAGSLTEAFTSNMTSNTFSVIVDAAARFKVGIAATRLYDIKVTCEPVDFFHGRPAPVVCS